jgi:hypothetical protein
MADRRGYVPVGAVAAVPSVAVVNRRCNPYGHETGGPKHLMGGLYGPEYEGKYKWHCENVVNVRARATCPYGHKGQIMDLCRPHAIEIQKRQMGLCTRCAWPPEAIQWDQAIRVWQQELAVLHTMGLWESPRAASTRLKIEDAGHRMTELYHIGVIKNVGLRLTEIS